MFIEVFSSNFLEQLFLNCNFSKSLEEVKPNQKRLNNKKKTPIVIVQHASLAQKQTADRQVVIGDAILQFSFFFRLCFSCMVFRIAGRNKRASKVMSVGDLLDALGL